MSCGKRIFLLCFGTILFTTLQLSSCSSTEIRKDGVTVFQNQQNLKTILGNIAGSQDDYSVKAFSRKTQIRSPLKQPKLLVHSFYLLTMDNGEYHSLSYLNTKSVFSSGGAWVYDKKTDLTSYDVYITGKNKWNVKDLYPEDTIDERQTLVNIIDTINSGVKYYYKDHLKHKPNSLNCNTALYETVVFRK